MSCALASLALGACTYRVEWPAAPVTTLHDPDGAAVRAFAIGGRRVNYWQRLEQGRIVELRFDDDGDMRPDSRTDLRRPMPDWPHCVIILDGTPFEVVSRMREEGSFRLFPPPARMVSTFPAMTDVALSRILRTRPCKGIEAQYFDREKNAVTSGNAVYLSGENAPWTSSVQYAAPQDTAVNTYLDPPRVFSAELRDMHALFNRTHCGRAIAYSVGSAGLGTRRGEAGIREYLAVMDRLVERVSYDKRGRVRFTLLADHGQNCHPLKRVSFRDTLEAGGFRIAKSLQRPEDVVVIEYGLVTCATIHTGQPAAVSAALVGHAAVELVAYCDRNDGDADIVVQSREGMARIRKADGGWRYDMSEGDPLQLAEIVGRLREAGSVSEDGLIDDRALFDATVTHRFPDPLHRLWDAFHGLVENPADVYVSLANDACHGSKFFHFFIAPVESTHGSLDYASSVTFLMSNASEGPLPAALRVDDALDWIESRSPISMPAIRAIDTQ